MEKKLSQLSQLFENNTEKLINIIQTEFKEILNKAFSSSLSNLNEHIKRVYISKIEDTQQYQAIHDLIVDVDTDSKETHYQAIHDLIVDVDTDSKDNFQSFSESLQNIKNKRNFSKNFENIEYPVNSHWLPYHIGKLLYKLEKNSKSEHIAAELIATLACYYKEKGNPDIEILFQRLVSICKEEIPHLWNSSVYVFAIISSLKDDSTAFSFQSIESNTDNENENEDEDKNESTDDFDWDLTSVPTAKAVYRQVICLVILNSIHYQLSGFIRPDFGLNLPKQVDEEVCFQLKPSYLERCEVYFLSGSNWRNPLQDMIVKNAKNHSSLRQKLFYTAIFAMANYLKRDEILLQELGLQKEMLSNRPLLYDIVRRSFRIKEVPTSNLFPETTDAINEGKASSFVTQILDIREKLLKNQLENKEDLYRLFHDLVLNFDQINVDFTSFSEIDILRKNSDENVYISQYLLDCENVYVEMCQKDIFFEQAFQSGGINYQALRKGLSYKNPKLNYSIEKIYAIAKDKIKNAYYSKEHPKVFHEYTDFDLIQILEKYAYHLMKNLTLKIPQQDEHELKPSLVSFFKSADVLKSNKDFVNESGEFFAFAGAGAAKMLQDSSIKAITDFIYEVLCICCKREKRYWESHFEFCSNDFLIFGFILLTNLPDKKRQDVIIELYDKNKQNPFFTQARACHQIILHLFATLFIQRQDALSAKSMRIMFETLFWKNLYPQHMFALKPLKDHPYISYLLEELSRNIEEPLLEENAFPSPYGIYLVAAFKALEESNSEYFKKIDNVISMNSSISINSIEAFYDTILLMSGLIWRWVNRDFDDNIHIDSSIFEKLVDKCSQFWDEADKENDRASLLKLVWGTQLLLVSLCDCIRAKKLSYNLADAELIKVAVLADYYQRVYSHGYQELLEGHAKDFYMISGAIRVSSLKPDLTKKILLDKKMKANYRRFLEHEKDLRFFWLTLRFLRQVTDFDITLLSKKITQNSHMLDHPEAYFLPYDNLSVEDFHFIENFAK